MSRIVLGGVVGFVAISLGGLMACGGTSRAGSPLVENIDQVTAATEAGDFYAHVEAGNAHWEMRSDLAETEAAIASWEAAIRTETPDSIDRNEALYPLFVSLARAHYWLADGHLRWEDPTNEEVAAVHQIGMEYGQQAMAMNNDEWTRALLYETPVPDAVSTLNVSDTPAVYWYATNAGRWALATSIAEILARKDDIEAMMTRVIELNPSLFHGGPDRYFGVYFTKIPFGNPALDRSVVHFENAMANYPEYLDNYFLFAEEYCRVTNNRERAVEALEAILAFDVTSVPELMPENANTVRKAQQMMDELDEHFN